MSIDVFGSCAKSGYARDMKTTYKEGGEEGSKSQERQ